MSVWHEMVGGRHVPWYKKMWSVGGCGQNNFVTTIAVSPDGQRIASGSQNTMVFVFDTRGKCITKLTGHREYVNQVAWSRDGGMLASCSNDGSVRIWDPHTGNCTINEGHSEPVISISWSPDGKLVSCSHSLLKIWDNDVLICSRCLPHTSGRDDLHASQIRDAAFGGGGMAVAKLDGIEIWDHGYQCHKQIPGYATVVRWSHDGKLAFARGGAIHLLANKEIVQLGTHARFVTSLAWSPDGIILASAARGDRVIIWDTVNRRKMRKLQTVAEIECVQIDRGAARVVACGDGQITVWALRASRLLTALRCIRTRLRILSRQRKAVELGECTEDRAAYWIRKACDSRVSELILEALAHWIW